MENQDAMEFLRKEPIFWSRLGFAFHPPSKNENGEYAVMSDFEDCANSHRQMTEAGAKIHTSILFSGWTGPDEYDYTVTDRTVDALFKNNPDIWYIPRIKLDAPVPWLKEHPEDVSVYHGGPENPDEIKKLAGAPEHDCIFYGKRPDVKPLIGMQSFSSPRWLRDAGGALRRLIARLENGPFGDRILAYHVGFGICGETNVFGLARADHSLQNRKLFFQWALKKYNSPEKLRLAWGEPDLTEEKCAVPPPELRENRAANLRELFRAVPGDTKCVDYDMFLNDVNADAIEFFCRAAKEASGKPAGAFFGYIFETWNSATSGYLCYDRIINSPYVDFIASPKSYYRCAAGEPGGVQAVAQSFSRKKLYIDEMDIHLHTAKTDPWCRDIDDTRYVLWREFAKNQQFNSGFWWMDLGGDWYTDIETRMECKKITGTLKTLDSQSAQNASEILIVADEAEAYHRSATREFHRLVLHRVSREVAHCAVPYDIYRLADLETLDLSAYKMICFLNCFLISDADAKVIRERIPPGAMLLYNYAFGIRAPEFSLSNIERRTGFAVHEKPFLRRAFTAPAGTLWHKTETVNSRNFVLRPEPGTVFDGSPEINSADFDAEHQPCALPLLEIAPAPGDEILLRYDDGSAAAAMRRADSRTELFCAEPVLGTEHFRRLAKLAGCHLYSQKNCAIFENSQFIGAFAHDDSCREIFLKTPGNYQECSGGQKFCDAQTLPLKKRFGFFLKLS